MASVFFETLHYDYKYKSNYFFRTERKDDPEKKDLLEEKANKSTKKRSKLLIVLR